MSPMPDAAVSEDLEVVDDTDERRLALERLKQKRDLRGHVVAYVVINAAVWGIWAATGAGYPWPAWMTGLWGIGLLMNAWDVHGRRPVTEADVQREIERLHGAR
jgi:2TM domain